MAPALRRTFTIAWTFFVSAVWVTPAAAAPAAWVTPAAAARVTPAAAAPAAWDHPGYDAENSHYNPGEFTINAGTIANLARRWSVPLRRREGACGGPSAPLTAAGRVVATDQLGISAYRAATGQPAWRFDWPDPDDSSTPAMAISGGTLLAANEDCQSMSDPSGRLVALDLTTGRVRWQTELAAPPSAFTVDKGLAVISGDSPSDELSTIAYRIADGRVAWQKPGYSASSVSADGIVLLTRGHTTTAVDILTGHPLWTKQTAWHAENATPTSDRFLVTNGTTLSAVNAVTGALTWTATTKQGSLMATDGRRVYRSAGLTVEALDTRTGHRLWSRLLPVTAGQPTRAGGLLYTSGGPVLVAATGVVISAGSAFAGAQIVTGGHLLTANGNTLAGFAP